MQASLPGSIVPACAPTTGEAKSAPSTGAGREERTTLESVFAWLIRCASVASCLLLVEQLGFYLAIRSLSDAADPRLLATYATYLGVTCAGVALNGGAWWLMRRTRHWLGLGSSVLVGNSLLAMLSWFYILELYSSLILPLLIPAWITLAALAGLLGRVSYACAFSALLSLEYAIVLFVAIDSRLEVPAEVIAFAPATCALMFGLSVLMAFVSKRLQVGEQGLRRASLALTATNRELEEAQALLSRYVAPQLAEQIAAGRGESVERHERRKLTIFFSDIKDFTATTDAMEPEDMAVVLNRYLREMVEIADSHGGTVAQISGDGLFIFFGAPTIRSDREHALQAVQMAIAMQQRMASLQREWFDAGVEHPFEIRCGINTGMATVGGFGSGCRREYTAIGMQTNLAARLEAACTPGEILISHSTWALVKDEVTCEAAGELTVKGFHRPLRSYQVCFERSVPTVATLLDDDPSAEDDSRA